MNAAYGIVIAITIVTCIASLFAYLIFGKKLYNLRHSNNQLQREFDNIESVAETQ